MSVAVPGPRVAWREFDGVMLLDKPEGLSSNAALQRARRALRAAKAGHAGTLDPLATGMLPLCFGQATKACGTLLGGRKAYRMTLQLGSATGTGDREGAVTARAAVPMLAGAAVDAAVGALLGAQMQVPPMYSALKRDGQPLYKLARAGLEVERQPRPITVYRAQLESIGASTVEVILECSSGTYVRVLGEDLARALGTVGHLAALRRLWVEPFAGRAMVSLADLETWAGAGEGLEVRDWPAWCAPVDTALQRLPALRLEAAAVRELLHGRAARDQPGPPQTLRAYDPAGVFFGLVARDAEGELRVQRLFVDPARWLANTQT